MVKVVDGMSRGVVVDSVSRQEKDPNGFEWERGQRREPRMAGAFYTTEGKSERR